MSVAAIITLLKQYNVFPRVDGDSLKLAGNTSQLPADVLDKVRAAKNDLIVYLKNAIRQIEASTISPIAKQAHYPVSNAQKRIWVLSQFDGGNTAYNITTHFFWQGAIDRTSLQQALQLLVQRHESLRTIFKELDGEPVQIVQNEVRIDVEDLTNQPESEVAAIIKAAIEKESGRPFNLSTGPLVRLGLLSLPQPNAYLLILSTHHIITDGWSIAVMMKELVQYYTAFVNGEVPQVEPPSIQYKEYSNWLEQRLQSPKALQDQQYWKAAFEQAVDPLNLPLSFARPSVQNFEGAVTKFYLDEALYADITAFCQAQQVTLFNFLRATVGVLLAKLCGQQTIVVGSPVAGRYHNQLLDQVGLYVNTLPLKTVIEADMPFVDWMHTVATDTAKAFEHQEYPLDKIMDDLAVKRSTSSSPLFDVMLVLQDAAAQNIVHQASQDFSISTNDAVLDGIVLKRGAKFDITFNFSNDTSNRFYAELEYATSLFTQERIAAIFNAFVYIVQQVLNNPQQTISNIQSANAQEQQKILQVFNRPIGQVDTPSINALLKNAFDAYRTTIALKDTKDELSYAQLQQYASGIAAKLSPIIATDNNRFVGLMTSRSVWMITAIAGIIQAGGAYVPIDITYPASRVGYIVEDAQLELILVDDAGLKKVPADYQGRILHINELLEVQESDTFDITTDRRQQTAYLIYTSGSTGKPKGVEITHQNAIAFLQWAVTEFAHTDYNMLYATTSYCFDLSVFEFFVPLLQGKTIRVLQSALEIQQYIGNDTKVMLNTVPSVVRNLLDAGMDWSNVAALNMAGEPIPKKIKAEIDYHAIEVRNLYGPSEDTTYSTIYRFEDDAYSFIPIGTPVGYTQLYIMDAYGHLQPEGVEGEIYLSGLSVAKGYYNKPELTAQRFLSNPFVQGMPMYKTGDVGKWLPDGQVAFSGRADDQVKVRGYRIEPGEIEFLLEQHPQVEHAVVVIKLINGANEMVAYWVSDDTLDSTNLKPWLSTQVPSWMVPAYWVKMDAIPHNSNGKTDKNRLPMPDATGADDTTVTSPENEWEQLLLQLWQEVLPQAGTFGTTHNFFNIGGHSLHAVKLRSLITKATRRELSMSELFLNATIRQQAIALAAKPQMTVQVITPVAQQEWYSISHAQERLWVMASFEAASRAYNMPAAFRITGNVDVGKLETAFSMIVQRHEILRTVFGEKDGQPVQRVLPLSDSRFTIHRFETGTDTDEALQQWIQQHDTVPFDLKNGPLLRCWLLQTNNGQVLYCNMHHIISDGWSVTVLNQEVIKTYQLLLKNNEILLPPLEIQYKDVAAWQKNLLTGSYLQEKETFWKQQFSNGVPVLELPTDFHRPDTKTYNGAIQRLQFGEALSQSIGQLAKEANVSLYTVLMAGVNVLLKKYTHHTDIVTGTTVAGRNLSQLENQIGFYVNALPVRTQVPGSITFNSLLQQQQTTLVKVYEHQAYPFEMLIDSLEVKRNLSRSPLFDVMVVLQNLQGQQQLHHQQVADELYFEHIGLHDGTAKYDLTFLFEEATNGLQLLLEYNTDLYKHETATQMMRHLNKIFEQVTVHPEKAIKDIALLDERDLQVLLSKADNTQVGYDTNATIVNLFGKAAAHFADNVALVVDGQSITYRELDVKSGQLALQLMQTYQVQPEDLVVLHFDRSEWMLIGILAVLKAGAAYVPADPAYPTERIDYIISDSQTKLVLYDIAPADILLDNHSDVTYIDITDVSYTGNTAQADVQPHHLAYVIYTSGTTGKPKGVLIEHRHVARLLFTNNNLFDFNDADRWSLFHSYCFDFSVWEMYGALLNGGTLVMVPKVVAQDSIAFYDFLAAQKITVLNQTPTAFRSLVQNNKARFQQQPLTTRYLIFGGEALLPEILKEWHETLPGCKNINMYGITETTVHVTYKEITEIEIAANKSNIGVPIPTLSCYVLDQDLQQVPVGVIGELCVGGAGVARGYLNQPELTAEKFIDNPLKPGEKLYRSGDYARILPNGDLMYIGRRDEQVKIRGHRIETAEVEAALMQQSAVKDAIVMTVKNMAGEHELAAYYIETNGADSRSLLRNSLMETLPSYMVPAYLIPLTAFPLNNNGKLDKQALPMPQEVRSQIAYVPPRNEIDKKIIAIWEEVLERDNIGIEDNFFDLGGHSLKATRVINHINDLYHIKIDLKEIFTEPTVAHLSNYIDMVQLVTTEAVVDGDDDKMLF